MTLQLMIDQAAPGDTVKPDGAYQIDSLSDPVRLKSNITLDLSGAALSAIPNSGIYSIILKIDACENVNVIGGLIRGERDTHLGPTNWEIGGGGAGISIQGGSRNIKIQGVNVKECFADGILILDGNQIEIDKVVCDHNRRQGMSVINCDGLSVISSQFSKNGGTPPGCGIDLECDTDAERIANVTIEKNVFYGNAGSCISFGSPGKYINCRVTADNSFDMVTQPIWAGGNASPLGTSWWAFSLNRACSWLPGYRWWGYRTEWYKA